MIQPRRERENPARRLLDHLHRRPALLRGFGHQLVVECLLELPVPGALAGQAFDAFHQKLRRPACQVEHHFGRHRQVIADLVTGVGERRLGSSDITIHSLLLRQGRRNAGCFSGTSPPGASGRRSTRPAATLGHDPRPSNETTPSLASNLQQNGQYVIAVAQPGPFARRLQLAAVGCRESTACPTRWGYLAPDSGGCSSSPMT